MSFILLKEKDLEMTEEEKDRIHTLRLILAAIKDKEIASRSSGQDAIISDENIIQILKKMVKQRNDSIEMFDKAGRDELVTKEKNEINFVSIYDEFKKENKRDFIFDNFIYGDIHWNLKGTKRVKDKIVESLKF